MLVLSRHREQSVIIRLGELEVRLIVMSAEWGKVRLGFEGPREIQIIRGELLEQPNQEKEATS
jgi:carbon storage regulator CsrA